METVTYVGLRAGDYLVGAELSAGAFAVVHEAESLVEAGKRAAVKFARPDSDAELQPLPLRSQAQGIFTGFIGKVRPDAASLLEHEAQQLKLCPAGLAPVVEHFSKDAGSCFAILELLKGQSLRSLAAERSLTNQQIWSVLDALSKLDSSKWTHGDIKPDNIIIEDSGAVKILDPGFFGRLKCREGNNVQCAVTTPEYYPLLRADDLLAAGIMLFELSTGRHPLVSAADAPKFTTADSLSQYISNFESVGQFYLSPLRSLDVASLEVSSGELLEVLLRGIGLSYANRRLERHAEPFTTIRQLQEAFAKYV